MFLPKKVTVDNLPTFGVMDSFLLPVEIGGEEREFPVTILRRGYVYAFQIDLPGRSVTIERDEEGNLRALSNPSDPVAFNSNEMETVEAVMKRLQAIL